MREKEKIDYSMKLIKEARNENIQDWGCSFISAVIMFIVIVVLIQLLS